jgi:hypothetical protein
MEVENCLILDEVKLVDNHRFKLIKSLKLLHIFIFDEKLLLFNKSLLILQSFKHKDCVIIIHEEDIVSIYIHSQAFF